MGVIERDRGTLYRSVLSSIVRPQQMPGVTWQASMIHIALEGGCFVLSANQFCRWQDYPPAPEYVIGGMGEGEPSPQDVVCAGGSVIISPSGSILAGPNFEGEGLITADLDPADIVWAKFDFDVVGHFARSGVLH
ncbi:unnamed protein product [Sphagnum troendelagicum]|uniref:CN hydrolase domain-containing protein n=1 Tax=Sphagnum troendelagicum TaxID=128251 RepID=A0ABP0UHS8_9BRYO